MSNPTTSPSQPTQVPTVTPTTSRPSIDPSFAPTQQPTQPTFIPTPKPSVVPTENPTFTPSPFSTKLLPDEENEVNSAGGDSGDSQKQSNNEVLIIVLAVFAGVATIVGACAAFLYATARRVSSSTVTEEDPTRDSSVEASPGVEPEIRREMTKMNQPSAPPIAYLANTPEQAAVIIPESDVYVVPAYDTII